MQISSYGNNISIPLNFRKYQNNTKLINVEEPWALGCLQMSLAGGSYREGCLESFPVPCASAEGNTVHRNKSKTNTWWMFTTQVFSVFVTWHVTLTPNQWQMMHIFMAENLVRRFSIDLLLTRVRTLTQAVEKGRQEGRRQGTPHAGGFTSSQRSSRVLWKDSFVFLLAVTPPLLEVIYKAMEQILIKIYISVTINSRAPYVTASA